MSCGNWKIKNIKQKCLNKDNSSSLFDIKDIKMKKESETVGSRSSIIKNNAENPDQKSKMFKNKKRNEKSDGKNSKNKRRFLCDDDDDHCHVDQEVVSKSETLVMKKKERKDLDNDNEELDQRIRTNNRKRKKDTDDIDDYRSSQDSMDSKSEEMSENQQQQKKKMKMDKEENVEKKKREQILSDETDEDDDLLKLELSEKQQQKKNKEINVEKNKKRVQILSDKSDEEEEEEDNDDDEDLVKFEVSEKQQKNKEENVEKRKKRVQILSDESDEDDDDDMEKLELSEKQQPANEEEIVQDRKKRVQISSDETDEEKLKDDIKEGNQDKLKKRKKALDVNGENPQKKIKKKNYNTRRKVPEKFDKENNNFEKLAGEIEEKNLDRNRSNNSNSNAEFDEELMLEAKEKNQRLDEILDEQKKKNSTPEMDIDVLRTLIVKLIHEVPEQHLLESSAGSHAPSPETIRRFRKFVELKKGTYTPEEDRIIKKNWKQFCKLHDWDPQNYEPLLNWRQDSKLIVRNVNERKRFVQFLANGLPNRTLYSVYHRFKNIHADHLQTRYTYDEDEAIIKYIEENSNSKNQTHVFADLAKILKRTRASVWRRYRLLKKKRFDE